jgi:hypothetical protein
MLLLSVFMEFIKSEVSIDKGWHRSVSNRLLHFAMVWNFGLNEHPLNKTQTLKTCARITFLQRQKLSGSVPVISDFDLMLGT